MGEKLKRASNFTYNEEILLLTLVSQKYGHIIENKRTDSSSNKTKNEAWVRIAEEFNNKSSAQQYRDTNTLKVKYANLKKRSKEKLAEQQHSYGAIERPSKEVDESFIEDNSKEILDTNLTGLLSEFGDDALSNQGVKVELKSSEDESDAGDTQDIKSINEAGVTLDFITSGSKNNAPKNFINPGHSNWINNYIPTQWQTPVLNDLKRKTKEEGYLKTKLVELATAKKNIASISEKCVIEENALKLQFLKEAHNEKMKQEREKHELEIKHMKELHELEVKRKKLELELMLKKIE